MPLRKVLTAMLATALLVLGVALVGVPPAQASTYTVTRVNQERAAAGVPPLNVAADITAVAQRWSEQMAASGTLAHNPNLQTQVGNWRIIGENVGRGGSEASIHDALMASPGHRRNILDRGYTEIGVGVASGRGSVWVTQVFRLPVQPSAPPAYAPIGALDSVKVRAGTNEVTVQGWTIDPDTAAPTSVHVYVNGGWGGAFPADASRPDVAAAHPLYGDRHGYAGALRLGDGNHEICAYAINVGAPAANPLLGCRGVSLRNDPHGSLDVVQPRTTTSTVRIAGWTADPNTKESTSVHVYVDGAWGGAFPARGSRPDVARAIPGTGTNTGYDADVTVPDGRHQVCVYAINLGAGGNNPLLGCRDVTVNRSPIGTLDVVQRGQGGVVIGGWTIDPDTPQPTSVHAYVDGRWGGAYPADTRRPDVAKAFPGFGERHGFQAVVPASGGQVCVYAINVGAGSNNPLLGCRSA